MSNSMEQMIQLKWKDEQAPIIDGVLFENGDLVKMRYEYFDNNNQMNIRIDKKTTLNEFLSEEPDMWTTIIQLSSAIWQGGNVELTCGEGGFGSDGFVAASDIHDHHLKWIAFFQKSNPFENIIISGSSAIATSTYQQIWTFPILHPEQVKVTGKKWGQK